MVLMSLFFFHNHFTFYQMPGPVAWVRQHSFVEIGDKIISTAILSLPLIQARRLSVTGERMCT